MSVKLGNKVITKEGSDVYFILEIGTNYCELGDLLGISHLEAAKKMINEAVYAGADAVKFQYYEAEKLASEYYSPEQYSYMRRHDSVNNWKDYNELINYAHSNNITFVTTIYDEEEVECLASKLPFFKVASPDITYIPLLKKINKYGKPVLLSIGGASLFEINFALKILSNCKVVIMHCHSLYPTPGNKMNLGRIRTLNRCYRNVIGYSHHNNFENYLLTAAYMGANVIEVHFKTNDNIKGNDYPVSINKEQAVKVRNEIFHFKKIFGNRKIERIEEENDIRMKGRRAIYMVRSVERHETIEKEDLIALRPYDNNLSPRLIKRIIGKRANRFIAEGEPVKLEYFD